MSLRLLHSQFLELWNSPLLGGARAGLCPISLSAVRGPPARTPAFTGELGPWVTGEGLASTLLSLAPVSHAPPTGHPMSHKAEFPCTSKGHGPW